MSVAPIGHERQITFFPSNGHTHNGENSSIVELQPQQIQLSHLDPGVLDYLDSLAGGGDSSTDGDLIPIPDLEIETNTVGAGASVTGSIPWTGICVVRWMRIVMSVESECTITFYHSATYADEDREFRARRCGTNFLWEGPWVHYDEDESKQIHYKIQNTGTASTRFNITLKAGTLVANGYANFVQSIQKQGSSVDPFIGPILFQAGNGITITSDETANMFTFDAVAPEAITINRMALIPKKPSSFTSSTTTTTVGSGISAGISTAHYVSFGTGLQWLKPDFGQIYEVGRVIIGLYPDGRVYNSVRVDSSTDNINWTTLMDSDTAFSTTQGLIIETPTGLNMRYLRIWANGSSTNTSNHVSGVTMYKISNKVGT